MIRKLAISAAGVGMLLSAAPKAEEHPRPEPAPPGYADVYRDGFGVPHIYASREEDAYFALGYAQAEDRLIGILSIILAVEGRSASVFGTGQLPWTGSALEADHGALRWRIAEQAREGIERLPERLQGQLDAYAAGFRTYMDSHLDAVPTWAPRVEAWHVLAWPQLLLWGYYVGDGMGECAAEGIKLADYAAVTTASRFASNEWAVSPARTADGRTILLSDPHGEIPAGGSPFYEYRMLSDGLNVTGFAFGPLPVLVHSPNVAWGMTTGGPDVSDCYRLTLDPDVEGSYRIHGETREFERRELTIEVKDGDPVKVILEDAFINGRLAPVVGRDENHAYAVVSSYTGALETLHLQIDTMIRAEDAEAALDAASIHGMFPQNVLIADSEGEIIYLRAGRTPIRPGDVDVGRAVSGDDPDSRWQGLHPVEDLVLVRNPATGYIQNNNTSPENMVAGAPLVHASDYPSYIWNENPAITYFVRADRVNAVLDADSEMTLEEAKALATDQHWHGSEKWNALLLMAVEVRGKTTQSWSAESQRVLQRLLQFDGGVSASSKPALAHYYWRTSLIAAITGEQRSDLMQAVANGTPSGEMLTAALAAVVAAAERMQSDMGSIDLAYGDRFRVGRSPDRHYPVGGGLSLELDSFAECIPLQRPAYGCALTPLALIHRDETSDGRPLVSHGSRALRLVVLGRPLISYSLYNFGQSDDPQSPHWDDQARELLSEGRLKRVPFAPADLAEESESQERLETGLPR